MYVKYIVPAYNDDGFEEITVTIKEAIEIQKQKAAAVRPGFVYENDDDALQDYLTVNWAYITTG